MIHNKIEQIDQVNDQNRTNDINQNDRNRMSENNQNDQVKKNTTKKIRTRFIREEIGYIYADIVM